MHVFLQKKRISTSIFEVWYYITSQMPLQMRFEATFRRPPQCRSDADLMQMQICNCTSAIHLQCLLLKAARKCFLANKTYLYLNIRSFILYNLLTASVNEIWGKILKTSAMQIWCISDSDADLQYICKTPKCRSYSVIICDLIQMFCRSAILHFADLQCRSDADVIQIFCSGES